MSQDTDFIGDLPVYKWEVTGIPVEGDAPIRRELEELFRSTEQIDKDQINLYLLGLARFQQRLENDPSSYFMLAGIHGLPSTTPLDGKTFQTGGFCAHETILFPTWHRAYLSLFEKSLWDIINEIAASYTDSELKERYQAAAKIWRLPYWDPAKIYDHNVWNGVGIPSLITWPTRIVELPTGEHKSIPNPLYSYVYHKGPDGRVKEMKYSYVDEGKTVVVDYSKLTTTARQPYATNPNPRWGPTTSEKEWQDMQIYMNNKYPFANQNNYHIVEIFREDTGYRKLVRDCLIETNDYVKMATTARLPGPPKPGVALESIHNTVHLYSGGVGQMGDVPVAAFDPIFWLHHCNIDRWLAIWEKLHPGAWWTPEDAGRNPKEQAENGIPTAKLFPFYKTDGQPWTPNDLRDILEKGGLGYSYGELALDADDLKREVERLYNALTEDIRSAPVRNRLLKGKVPLEVDTPEGQKVTVQMLAQDISTVSIKPDTEIYFDDYIATADFERFALKGIPFVIHFFLGDYEKEDPKSWTTAKARLGSVFNFVARSERHSGEGGTCQNCAAQEAAKRKVTGTVSLTQSILQGLQDPTLEKDVKTLIAREGIKKFIKKYLDWRVTLVDGTEVDTALITSLEIAVYRRQGKVLAADDNYDPPSFGEWTLLWNSTDEDS